MNMYTRNTPFQIKEYIVTYDFIITLYKKRSELYIISPLYEIFYSPTTEKLVSLLYYFYEDLFRISIIISRQSKGL